MWAFLFGGCGFWFWFFVCFGFLRRIIFILHSYVYCYILERRKFAFLFCGSHALWPYQIKQSSAPSFFMWIISMIKLLYSNCVIGALLVTLVEAKQQMYLRTILFKQSFWGKKKQSCFHSILRASLFGPCALGREACCW